MCFCFLSLCSFYKSNSKSYRTHNASSITGSPHLSNLPNAKDGTFPRSLFLEGKSDYLTYLSSTRTFKPDQFKTHG